MICTSFELPFWQMVILFLANTKQFYTWLRILKRINFNHALSTLKRPRVDHILRDS